ncbi:sortase [Micromonospora sp. M12]
MFARLGELRPGDRVEVWRGGQRLAFRVTGLLRTRKDRFPTDVVYGPTPGAELRLVTCGATSTGGGALPGQRRGLRGDGRPGPA